MRISLKNFLTQLALALVFTFTTSSTTFAAVYQSQDSTGLPTCDNAFLLDNVKAAIVDYYQQNPSKNDLERRQQLLMLRDISHFSQIPSANFSSEQDFNVASKIITLKINERIDADQIRLCKSQSSGLSQNIYLLIYYQDYEVLVDIVSFAPNHKNFVIKYSTI